MITENKNSNMVISNNEAKSLKKDKILDLKDRELQLRYFLSGLKKNNCGNNGLCHYWTCDINCSLLPQKCDVNFENILNFIEIHNLSIKRFIHFTYNFLNGSIMKYNGKYGPFFIELENILKPYNLLYSTKGKIVDNDYGEKELEMIFNSNSINSEVYIVLNKYKLYKEDFICIAKTSLNYNYYDWNLLSCKGDEIGTDISKILTDNNLVVSREYIKRYRNEYENAQLVSDVKKSQKEYLKLLKKLICKDSNLVDKVLLDELNELGIKTKKDIKKLFKNKKTK